MKKTLTVDLDKVWRNRGWSFSKGLLELYRDIPDVTNCKMIEIGCCSGESTIIAATFCAYVYAIDVWDNTYFGIEEGEWSPEMQFDLVTRGYDNIIKLKGRSNSFVQTFEDNSIDIVYLDGDKRKEAIEEDIRKYYPKIKGGGYLCGHDYATPYKGNEFVKITVDNIFGKPDKTYCDYSWVIQKKEPDLL